MLSFLDKEIAKTTGGRNVKNHSLDMCLDNNV